MNRRFFALQIISIIYKILAFFAFIGMIIAIVLILLDASTFPTMESKLRPIGVAFGSGIVGAIMLLAVAQLLDLLMAIEANTRNTASLLQRMGRVMQERL